MAVRHSARSNPETVDAAVESSRSRERRVLVLQGGGALGAYQAGVCEELNKNGLTPEWVAGISIGAINAAIIAGNAPDQRIDRLREFWQQVSAGLLGEPINRGDRSLSLFNAFSAGMVAAVGVPGFFRPRLPPPFLQPEGAVEAISYYDTRPLRATLERLVDFDRINAKETRLSVGAVNVVSGNFIYFDSHRQTIRPEHIMASGALPPGFPPVEIDGEYYWDGGLVSNTPLQYVLDTDQDDDLLVFQIDLFSALGQLPRNLSDATEREKDIRFSSRTRLNTDQAKRMADLRCSLLRVLDSLPAEFSENPDVAFLRKATGRAARAVSIVHLIYRSLTYETHTKDYDFSRRSVEQHWKAGGNDTRRTLRHRAWVERKRPAEGGVATFDLSRDAED